MDKPVIERDEVVGRIYEAVTDPVGWSRAIEAVMADVAGQQITLARFSASSHDHVAVAGRHDLDAMAICRDHYGRNLFSDAILQGAPGRAQSLDWVVPVDELMKTGFYADVLRPAEIRHGMSVNITADSESRFCLMIGRADRGFSDRELGRLDAYARHVERAWALAERFEGLAFVQRAQLDMLDGLGVAALLLGAHGEILYANRAAVTLERHGALLLSGASLRCADLAAASAFDAAVVEAISGRSPRPVLFRNRAASPLSMTATPISSRLADVLEPNGVRRPAALVSIHGAVEDGPAAEMLQELFGLTQAEARAASALAIGDGDAETAARLGIGVNSLKTHRRRIFEKVGVSRQAQLARLLARLPNRA